MSAVLEVVVVRATAALIARQAKVNTMFVFSLAFSFVSGLHEPSIVSRRRPGGWMQAGKPFWTGVTLNAKAPENPQ
jgi:hypothetical protein